MMNRLRGVMTGMLVVGATLAVSHSHVVADVLSEGEAEMSAIVLQSFDMDRAVAVRLYDDSPQNLALQDSLVRMLEEKGYTVSDDAALVLSFETVSAFSDGSALPRTGIIELQARAGSGSATKDDYSARLHLYSTTDDSLLGGRAADRTPRHGLFRLDLTLVERATGRRVWQGWAQTPQTRKDETVVARSLMEPLVESLGETVHATRFSLTAR